MEKTPDHDKFKEKSNTDLLNSVPDLSDIPAYSTFAKIEVLKKGWSSDKKFIVTARDGRRFLLRLADASEYSRKKNEYGLLQKVVALGVAASEPIDFGLCDGGRYVYQLLSWIAGKDVEVAMASMDENEQYALGVKAGQFLQKVHLIHEPESSETWESFYKRKLNWKIAQYRECGIRVPADDRILSYLEANSGLLAGRPRVYQHGDYHIGNMIVSDTGNLAIIDWNRSDFGDPWEEFNRIVWSAEASPHFATG